MKSDKRLLMFIALLFFLALVSQVSAQGNFLDDVFDPFRNINVAQTYEKYQPFIDAFLYFIFFISVAKVTLSKRFSGPGGNALVVTIGLILAISMSWWASSIGFTLKSFGLIAAGVFVGVIFFSIFAFIKHQGGNVAAASALGYVLVFLLVLGIMPGFVQQIREGPAGLRTIWGLANIVFLIALVIAIMGIARWFRGEWVSGGGGYGGGKGGGGWFKTPEERAARRDERKQLKKDKEEAKADEYSQRLSTAMSGIKDKMDDLTDIEDKIKGFNDLHTGEEWKEIARLEAALRGMVTLGNQIASAERYMRANPLAFDSTRRASIINDAQKYKSYFEIVERILQKVAELLHDDERKNWWDKEVINRLKKLRKLMKKYSNVEQALTKEGNSLPGDITRNVQGAQERLALVNRLKADLKDLKLDEKQEIQDVNKQINMLRKVVKSLKQDENKIKRQIELAAKVRLLDLAVGTLAGLIRFMAVIRGIDTRGMYKVVQEIKNSVRRRSQQILQINETLIRDKTIDTKVDRLLKDILEIEQALGKVDKKEIKEDQAVQRNSGARK
jgi:hypothetical protein